MRTTIVLFIIFTTGFFCLSAQNTAFEGMTKPVGYDKMITPLGVQVTFNKTVHIIFPSAIRYVDLGSANLIAGKAEAAENVLRIKSATENFIGETNFSVICSDGSFYSFNAYYAKEPEILNIEIKDFLQQQGGDSQPNKITAHLPELHGENPALVDLILKSIYRNNDRRIKHLGCTRFGIQTLIKGLYVHDGLLYIHVQIRNSSNVPFTVDFSRFKIVDKKLVKRTAIQERVINPLRSFNEEIEITGKSTVRTVFCLQKFTIPDDKILMFEIFEKDGGRNQAIRLESADIELSRTISELKTK